MSRECCQQRKSLRGLLSKLLTACGLFLGLFAGLGWAAVGLNPALKSSCEIMPIEASRRGQNGKTFRQLGVGWSLLDLTHARSMGPAGDLVVLAPAHLVWGFERLSARCGAQTIALRARAISPSLDLALLELSDKKDRPATLIPLLQFSGFLSSEAKEREALIMRGGTVSLWAHAWSFDFDSSPDQAPTAIRATVEGSNSARTLWPYERAIFFLNGVKPGFSGAPLLLDEIGASEARSATASWGSTVIGMVTRTANNGHSAVAIPLGEILRSLPALLNAEDPYADLALQSARIRYEWTNDGSQDLERIRVLEIKPSKKKYRSTKDGLYALRELCEATSLSPVGGADWGDGGGALTGGGARSFPPIPAPELVNDENSFVKGRLTWNNNQEVFFPRLYHYKNFSRCKADGILLPDGRRLVWLKASGKDWIKVESLDDLLSAVADRDIRDLPSLLDHSGVFVALNQAAENPVCRIVGNGDYFHFAETLRLEAESQYAENIIPLILKSQLAKVPAFEPHLSCRDKGKTLRLRSGFWLSPRQLARLEMDLEIGAQSVTGHVVVGRCKTELRNEPKQRFWSARVQNDDFTLDINFAHEKPVRMTLLSVSPRCKVEGDDAWPWITIVEGFQAKVKKP